MRKKWLMAAIGGAVLLAAVAGGFFYFRSRVLTVWVYTDYAFRFNHADWPKLVAQRFEDTNRIYQRNGLGIRFAVVDSSQIDPTRDVPGLDNRRATMALHFDRPADIYVNFTGIHEGNRTGSVSPFTRVAMIVDFPNKSEAINARLLAHELAHLFGAPHDPAWLDTLMSAKPDSNKFSPRTIALIKTLRQYPFPLGIDGLAQDSWDKKALEAIAKGDTGSHFNALAYAHTVLGTALLNERKRQPAITHFLAAVAAEPSNELARLNLIEAYTRNGQEDEALTQARELVKQHPDDAMAHRSLGAMLGRNHQLDAGVQELEIASRLDPKNVDNRVLLGMELAGGYGHIDDAISVLQEAAQTSPNSPKVRYSLAEAEALKRAVAQEMDRQRAALRQNPNDPDAAYRLAKVEARAGDLKAAIRDFQKSADLRPSNGSPHVELASLYLATGDVNSAWEEVRKARLLGTEPPQSLLVRMPAPK